MNALTAVDQIITASIVAALLGLILSAIGISVSVIAVIAWWRARSRPAECYSQAECDDDGTGTCRCRPPAEVGDDTLAMLRRTAQRDPAMTPQQVTEWAEQVVRDLERGDHG